MKQVKTYTCIGFSVENYDWLKQMPDGMSNFLNDYVSKCRNEGKPVSKLPTESVANEIKEVAKQRREAIKAVLVKNPLRWLAKVKTSPNSYNKGLRTQILNTVKLEFNIKTTDDEVAEVFHEVFKTFDWNTLPKEFKEHLIEQGLMRETKRGHAEFV